MIFPLPTNDGTLQTVSGGEPDGISAASLRKSPAARIRRRLCIISTVRRVKRVNLWDLNPTLYLPVKLGPYLQVTPWVGFRGSIWDRTDSEADTEDKYGTREIFPVGGTFSTEISRVFTVGSGIGGVEKIRHSIRPEIYLHLHSRSPSGKPSELRRRELGLRTS